MSSTVDKKEAKESNLIKGKKEDEEDIINKFLIDNHINIANELKDSINKFIKLFQEMLDFKNVKYNKNIEFIEYLKIIPRYYYKYDFTCRYKLMYAVFYQAEFIGIDVDFQVKYDPLTIDEALTLINECYDEMKSSYKECAYEYYDIILKENQSLSDLIEEEKEKTRILYLEALEELNIKVDKKDDFDYVSILVDKYYPNVALYNQIEMESKLMDPMNTQVSKIHALRNNYKKFKENYKGKGIKKPKEIEFENIEAPDEDADFE